MTIGIQVVGKADYRPKRSIEGMHHLEVEAMALRVAESRREFVAASETVACGNAGWHRDSPGLLGWS